MSDSGSRAFTSTIVAPFLRRHHLQLAVVTVHEAGAGRALAAEALRWNRGQQHLDAAPGRVADQVLHRAHDRRDVAHAVRQAIQIVGALHQERDFRPGFGEYAVEPRARIGHAFARLTGIGDGDRLGAVAGR